MFFEPLSLGLLFGPTIIMAGVAVGINPMLMCGTLNVMTHAMGQMTPPFALTFYVPVSMAKADLWKSTKEVALWCLIQFIFIVLVLYKILPVAGLVAN